MTRMLGTGQRHTALPLVALAVLDMVAMLISLQTGPVGISFPDIFHAILGWTAMAGVVPDPSTASIVVDIRLPRVLMAALSGGALSVSGILFQALLRNILADPYILGVSSGAAVGALLSMLTGVSALFYGATTVCAFIGALSVIMAVYIFGAGFGYTGKDTMLLSGVMVGAFFGAVILILLAVLGDPLRSSMFWLLGYFGNATFFEVTLSALVILLCITLLIPLTPGINALSLGSQQASHLGVPVRGVSSALYIIGSLLAAVVVSFVGTIAFVGLIVPHFARRILGSDHRILIPGSFLLGVLFLVVSDLLARTILYPVEMPVGAITSALGAPLVVYILRKER